MSRYKLGILVILFSVLLPFGGKIAAERALTTPKIDWWTVDTGGGLSTGGDYSLESSIGQSDAGATMTSGTYSLTGGYQVSAAESIYTVYLPLVLKL